mgnify:CR=1 FL=1
MIVFCILLFGIMMRLIMRYWIVKPLLHYTRSIQNGLITPVGGVNELQLLAKTYNLSHGRRQRGTGEAAAVKNC